MKAIQGHKVSLNITIRVKLWN